MSAPAPPSLDLLPVAVPPAPHAAGATLLSLPLPLSQRIFLSLPLDERARAALVCRGWCALLTERSLWTRLDLSPSSGLARARVTDAFLRGAAAKARGSLTALDVSSCTHVSSVALLGVLRRNAGALRTLRVFNDGPEGMRGRRPLEKSDIEPLLRAAPACELHADVFLGCTPPDGEDVIRKEPPFDRLHIRILQLLPTHRADEAHVVRLARAIATHTPVTGVCWAGSPLGTAAALDAVMDAALARNISFLGFVQCKLSPTVAPPALARLVRGGVLATLRISNFAAAFDAPGAALLGDALRESRAITSLDVSCLLFDDVGAAVALLQAVTAHPSLQELTVRDQCPPELAAAVGAALGALVAADAPALRVLYLGRLVGDAALRPLFDALPQNTHLRTLIFSGGGRVRHEFVRDTLLPAVHANTSLRSFEVQTYYTDAVTAALLRDAHALVAARAAA
jgi:hypothetical protein